MFNFLKILKRVQAIIPINYKRVRLYFFLLSLLSLVLDIFSIFILIPLIISLLDQNLALDFIPVEFLKDKTYILLVSVITFFIIKNFITIKINTYQSKVIFKLGSEYAIALSNHYILGNYLAFKKQKKSSILKEIIFVTNDFVSNVVLSLNIILSELVLLIAVMSVGLYFYFSISLFIIFVLALIVVSLRYYNRKVVETINKNLSEDYDNNISNLTNLLNGFMSIKSPDLIRHFMEIFSSSNRKLNQNYAIMQAKRMNMSKQTEIIIVLLICFVFAYINFSSTSGSSPVVFLSIFGTLLFKAIPSLNKLNIALTNLNSYKYTLDILEKKLTAISKISNSAPLHFEKEIKIQNISFSYGKDKHILKNVTLTIQKGDFVAIHGKSGTGKTTFLNIISKLINANSGEIILDNTRITDTNKYQYFSLITYLTQDPFVYEGTVLENLVLNNKVIGLEKIKPILDELDILEAIEHLPNKLNNYIGIEGNNLSGGQLQRLCIARALLNDPKILILDEATNNLDNHTEKRTLRCIKNYAKEHQITVISVSHHIEKEHNLYSSIYDLKMHNEA